MLAAVIIQHRARLVPTLQRIISRDEHESARTTPSIFTGDGSVNTRTRTLPVDTGGIGTVGSGGGHPASTAIRPSEIHRGITARRR